MANRSAARIAIVAHGVHEDGGGMERAFAELIRRAHRDYPLLVISRQLDPNLRPLVEWCRVRAPARPRPLHFVLFYLLGGILLGRVRVDLVHTLGACVPNKANLASVHFCHAGFHSEKSTDLGDHRPRARRINTGIARALGYYAERWSYGRGRIPVLAAVSEGVGRELEHHYQHARVFLTPNGVDTKRFRPNQEARRVLRDTEGLDDDVFVALFVGGDWDHKGLSIAIEALAWPGLPDHPSIRLWIVGSGDERRFRALASRRGVMESVRFFGARNETERFYQAADVFILPSAYESFSLVCFEAGASGIPVVATRVNGVEDLVGDDEGGFILPRKPAAFGAALGRLATDSELRRRKGESACRRASKYTWERSTESVLEIYRELLGATRQQAEGRAA